MGVPNHSASGKFLYRENTTLLIATRNIAGVWNCSILLCAPISLTVWYAVQCLYEVYSISGDICNHRNLISPICPFASHSPLSKQNIQAYEYMVAILYTRFLYHTPLKLFIEKPTHNHCFLASHVTIFSAFHYSYAKMKVFSLNQNMLLITNISFTDTSHQPSSHL
jgi:hypothetical protein